MVEKMMRIINIDSNQCGEYSRLETGENHNWWPFPHPGRMKKKNIKKIKIIG